MASWPPRTWVDGDTPSGDDLNESLRDPMLDLDQHVHDGTPGGGDDEITPDKITFDDQAASPSAAGELQRNGTELEYFGTAVVAITEANAAVGTPSPRSMDGAADSAAPYTHGHSLANFSQDAIPPDVVGAAQGTTLDVYGEYTIPTVTTTIINDYTDDKKVCAFLAHIQHCNTGGTGQLKAAIDVDGTEQISYTWAVGVTRGNIDLLALAVKNTADPQFEFILDNQTSVNAVVTVQDTSDAAAGGVTTTPDQVRSQGDLGVV